MPATPNAVWSVDFMADALRNGRRFRTFNVLEDFAQQWLKEEGTTRNRKLTLTGLCVSQLSLNLRVDEPLSQGQETPVRPQQLISGLVILAALYEERAGERRIFSLALAIAPSPVLAGENWRDWLEFSLPGAGAEARARSAGPLFTARQQP